MNQQSATAAGNAGPRLFLYDQPELLTVEAHGHLGLQEPERPFDFVKSVRAVPIAAAEIGAALKCYPIVFSDLKNPALLAIVAVFDDVNLFVGDDGDWEAGAYIPAYLRCHPFALAPRPNDQYAVVIDRAAPTVTDKPEQPFFDGRELASPIQSRVDFCAQFNAHRQSTKAFCDRLVELNLLSGQQASYKPDDSDEERSLGSYVAVDFERLNALDANTIGKLHADGTLSAIYGHRFSLENWFRLLERRIRRGLPVTGIEAAAS